VFPKLAVWRACFRLAPFLWAGIPSALTHSLRSYASVLASLFMHRFYQTPACRLRSDRCASTLTHSLRSYASVLASLFVHRFYQTPACHLRLDRCASTLTHSLCSYASVLASLFVHRFYQTPACHLRLDRCASTLTHSLSFIRQRTSFFVYASILPNSGLPPPFGSMHS
jgi:hypothetical protein